MALGHTTKVFAVSDAKVSKLTADVTGTPTYAASVDVPGIKKVGLSFDLKNVELRGDNQRLDSDSILVGCKATFDHAKVSMDALPIFIGGTAADTGTTPSQVTTFTRVRGDTLPYFKLEGATPTAGVDTSTGDLHLVLNKLKVSKYDLGLAEEDYQLFSGEAVGVFPISSGELFRLVMNETAAVIS